MTVEQYIAGAGALDDGFFEREISRVSETFGGVTHRFSTYESRGGADDPKPFARGINSIQLLNDGQRWWVVTVLLGCRAAEQPAGGALIALAAFAVPGGDGGLARVEGGLSLSNVALLLAYAALMLGVCLLACVVPTRRALNVEPTEALRAE